jgi:hypothetical protein
LVATSRSCEAPRLENKLCDGSARLAKGWSWFVSLPGNGFGRRADSQICGPAVGKNLPGTGRLPHEDDQVFSALFAAFPHGDRDEHFATAEIKSNLTEHFQAQRFHLDVA